MKIKIILLSILTAGMFLLKYLFSDFNSPSLIVGFMLLSSYLTGEIITKLKLPKITGYIIGGLVFGPHILGFYKESMINELSFLNSMALAFIAFTAGAELRKKDFLKDLKVIVFLTFGVTFFVFIGVTASVFFLSGIIPFMKDLTVLSKIGIASIFGVISVARSPSSTIAIISETKSKGRYTSTVLSSTIVTDVLIIILFAITVSFGEILIKSTKKFDPGFILHLLAEIVLAFIIGFLLGRFILIMMSKFKVEFSILLIGLGFFVIKFSHILGDYLTDTYTITLNLEPLLICMAAGFTVQNFSDKGEIFLKRMEKISIPIFLTFFSITGASINLVTLSRGWFLGLITFFSRIFTIFLGSFFSGKISGGIKSIYSYSWLGFLTQAGVSLGLLFEVIRRFPKIGPEIQTILIATITLNQIVGPVALKIGLMKAGDSQSKS